ncbi:MAG: M23 family metallopeptidase [Bacteroidota bacterium]|nr:M23 family metallopeptidase [Bacteroidota bacterium]
MGEPRPNHFHGGLDIKTDQRTGLPVYAAADGYIYRIAVSSKGYGNALYIKHYNGLITVYGHLEWFNGAIGKYMKDLLYANQCNENDHLVPPNLLKVKKGDTIAWSGNTGSSGGPHLHWEIRDADENLLNPLFFNFSEIKDNMKPFANKIALRTMDINSRVEGEFGRVEFVPKKIGNDYVLNYPIHAQGLLGLELIAYDFMNGTGNKMGLSLIEVKVDGKEVFVHDIQKIRFEDNVFVNAHLEYGILKEHGNYFQRCYVSDGNMLNTYCYGDYCGKIMIKDTLIHYAEVILYDSYRNQTIVKFRIKGTKNHKPSVKYVSKKHKYPKPLINHIDYENTLKISAPVQSNKRATLFITNIKIDLDPAYIKGNEAIYLWDLRKGLPDSIFIGKLKHSFDFDQVLPSNNALLYSHPYMDIIFQKNAILDTFYFSLGHYKGIYSIHDHRSPLFSSLTVTLKPDFEVPNKEKVSVYNYTPGGGYRFAGGEWRGNSIKFRTKILGDFVLREDTIGPKIKFKKRIGKSVFFNLTDNLSGIAHWYAYLNGKFLLMHYDPKFGVIFSDLQQDNEVVSGQLLIGAIDNCGNISQSVFNF